MGQSGNFTSQALAHKPISGMNAIPVGDETPSRPKLELIHNLLDDIDGEGFRPLTPLRTAMMKLIAGIVNQNQLGSLE